MWWLGIDLILICVAAGLFVYIYHNNGSENYDVVLPFIVGIFILIIALFSELVRALI